MTARDFTAEERRSIQNVLANGLGPEFISYRPQAGAKVAYLEGTKAISTLQHAACCVSFTMHRLNTGRYRVAQILPTTPLALTGGTPALSS